MLNDSIAKRQKNIRPKIEDVICEYFADVPQTQQNALDFVSWLRANKMSPTWAATDTWAFGFKKNALAR